MSLLGPFTLYPNVWVEITRSTHQHAGLGWEFGRCLWSPSRDRAGHDRYALMRRPRPSDLVLHFYYNSWPDGAIETRLAGRSFVASEYQEVFTEPPLPGQWAGMAPYYR